MVTKIFTLVVEGQHAALPQEPRVLTFCVPHDMTRDGVLDAIRRSIIRWFRTYDGEPIRQYYNGEFTGNELARYAPYVPEKCWTDEGISYVPDENEDSCAISGGTTIIACAEPTDEVTAAIGKYLASPESASIFGRGFATESNIAAIAATCETAVDYDIRRACAEYKDRLQAEGII